MFVKPATVFDLRCQLLGHWNTITKSLWSKQKYVQARYRRQVWKRRSHKKKKWKDHRYKMKSKIGCKSKRWGRRSKRRSIQNYLKKIGTCRFQNCLYLEHKVLRNRKLIESMRQASDSSLLVRTRTSTVGLLFDLLWFCRQNYILFDIYIRQYSTFKTHNKVHAGYLFYRINK